MREYSSNIEKLALKNNYYRKVLFTANKMQLVVMSLNPKEDIPFEVHHNRDQFIRIESGNAEVTTNGRKHKLKDGDVIIIPAGTRHRVVNSSPSKKLKVYTIYATPEHPQGTIHKTRADALMKELSKGDGSRKNLGSSRNQQI